MNDRNGKFWFKQLLLDLLGWPVVVGHGSRLQGLSCVPVHQGTAPVVFTGVPCVGDVNDVVAGQAEWRRVTQGLHVEIDAHVEGVGAHKVGRLQLRTQPWVGCKVKKSMKATRYKISLFVLWELYETDPLGCSCVLGTPAPSTTGGRSEPLRPCTASAARFPLRTKRPPTGEQEGKMHIFFFLKFR